MTRALLLGVLMAVGLAFGHTHGLNAASQDKSENDRDEAIFCELKQTIHKDQRDLERFDDLLKRLDGASRESNSAHRQALVGEIVNEMRQEIKQLRHKLSAKFFLPEETVTSEVNAGEAGDSPPEVSTAVFSGGQERLTAMEEIYRSCNEIQEPAMRRQGKALSRFTQESKKFQALMQEDFRVTRALLPAKYQTAGNTLSR